MFHEVLGYFDMTIIYLFCLFQLYYNYVTLTKIKQSKNKITWYQLIMAYAFWTAPIIYSVVPMIGSFNDNFSFGLFMLWMRIPPISITAIIIIYWTIYLFIHNKKVNTKENILHSDFIYKNDNFAKINSSKNIFKKNVVKVEKKYELKINKANNEKELIKIVEDIQGWYISKDKFSWMWFKRSEQTHNFYKQIFDNVCFKVKEKLNNFS
ncbi:MAG: hypothetical protein ACRDBR_02545 [Metamycoplasmataceae bacterium]